jgi:hypothetical protein
MTVKDLVHAWAEAFRAADSPTRMEMCHTLQADIREGIASVQAEMAPGADIAILEDFATYLVLGAGPEAHTAMGAIRGSFLQATPDNSSLTEEELEVRHAMLERVAQRVANWKRDQ